MLFAEIMQIDRPSVCGQDFGLEPVFAFPILLAICADEGCPDAFLTISTLASGRRISFFIVRFAGSDIFEEVKYHCLSEFFDSGSETKFIFETAIKR